jgi:nucleoid-associated protein YgaU
MPQQFDFSKEVEIAGHKVPVWAVGAIIAVGLLLLAWLTRGPASAPPGDGSVPPSPPEPPPPPTTDNTTAVDQLQQQMETQIAGLTSSVAQTLQQQAQQYAQSIAEIQKTQAQQQQSTASALDQMRQEFAKAIQSLSSSLSAPSAPAVAPNVPAAPTYTPAPAPLPRSTYVPAPVYPRPLGTAGVSVGTSNDNGGIQTTTYTVVSGDNLTKIARQYGVTLADLLSVNPQFRANPNLIHPGDIVNIPGGGGGGGGSSGFG